MTDQAPVTDDDLEFVRDYARRNDGYQLVQPVVDFINAHLDPPIIRTVEELEALDPDTLVLDSAGYTVRYGSDLSKRDLPLALIREGAEVRACREALEGETT